MPDTRAKARLARCYARSFFKNLGRSEEKKKNLCQLSSLPTIKFIYIPAISNPTQGASRKDLIMALAPDRRTRSPIPTLV